MESLLAATAVLILLGVSTYVMLIRRVPDGTVRAAEPESAHDGGLSSDKGNSPRSMNAFWADARPGEERRVHWHRRFEREMDGSVTAGSTEWLHATFDPDESWDPYDPRGEHRKRVRAARRRLQRSLGSSRGGYYALLGVDAWATESEIERAYRTRAAEIHPDRFFSDPARRGEAERQLKQLNAAVQVLRDPERRAEYDRSL